MCKEATSTAEHLDAVTNSAASPPSPGTDCPSHLGHRFASKPQSMWGGGFFCCRASFYITALQTSSVPAASSSSHWLCRGMLQIKRGEGGGMNTSPWRRERGKNCVFFPTRPFNPPPPPNLHRRDFANSDAQIYIELRLDSDRIRSERCPMPLGAELIKNATTNLAKKLLYQVTQAT